MIVHSQTPTAVSMGLDHGDSGSREMVLLPGSNFGELQRWGSVTSTASSSDWNDIGLPPLPRQRSISAPVWANLERQGSGAAAAAAAAAATQHYQHTLAMTGSGPLPQEYLMQQADLPVSLSMSQPLQPMGSDPMDALVQDMVYRHSSSPRSCAHADVETVYEDDSTHAWECLTPAGYAAAAAAAHGRSRRTQHVLHSSASMSSTTSTSSGSSFSQPISYAFSGRSSGSHSHSSISPMAIDSCNGHDRARSLPCLDRHSLPRHSEPGQQHARLNPQELAMLAKLKTIMSEKEQLCQVEKQLRHKLGEEASRAMSGSPRAAAQAAALKAALLHQQQRSSSTGSFSSHRSSPLPHQALPHSPAGHAAGSPPRRGNSTAAALLAASADPAVVAEYLCAHKLQQQQHQACMAAAAAAAAGSSPHGGHHARQQLAKRTAMSPAAMAKLKQLMALQQQQIQIQQELLSLLPPM